MKLSVLKKITAVQNGQGAIRRLWKRKFHYRATKFCDKSLSWINTIRFHHPDKVSWRMKLLKLVITHFSPDFLRFLSRISKFSPPIKDDRYNYSSPCYNLLNYAPKVSLQWISIPEGCFRELFVDWKSACQSSRFQPQMSFSFEQHELKYTMNSIESERSSGYLFQNNTLEMAGGSQ
jgi:hypothetical protein